jgi:hypothetical protein
MVQLEKPAFNAAAFLGHAGLGRRVSFLCDDIIRLRYVSIDAQLRKIMMVIKMRGGKHLTVLKSIPALALIRRTLCQRPSGAL